METVSPMNQKTQHIAIGRLWQETNTFAETRTSLADFRRFTLKFGEEMLRDLAGANDELAGFADVLLPRGTSLIPLVAASTWCGGPALPEVVDMITRGVVERLRAAPRVDAVLLSLHGALVGVDTPDVEGHLLGEIRAAVGPHVPIILTLDHHANVTRAMIDAVDVITAYHHCPHTDMRETGRRGAELACQLLEKKFRPAIAYQKIPLVTPCERYRTIEGPMRDWFAMARQFEQVPGVIGVSTFPVQPWLDVPEQGWSCIVVTDNDPVLAGRICAEMADYAWKRRDEFYVKKCGPVDAVRIAAAAPEGPVVIADGADATNAGSPGDSTCLLKEMLDQKITCRAMLTVVDPEAVALAYEVGIGAVINLDLGAKQSPRFHTPARVTATVVRFADGKFQISGHLSARVNMGRCALLRIGSIDVIVSEFAGPGHDPGVYHHLGLEPKAAQIVVVKATVGHMDAYASIMKLNLQCECPGPSPSYLEQLTYRNIPRPMYPFDRKMEWSARPRERAAWKPDAVS